MTDHFCDRDGGQGGERDREREDIHVRILCLFAGIKRQKGV